ncbi:MAG: FAD-binding oxidoreductase [Chloroflexota bacterium]
MTKYQIVIMGGGIIGSSIAYFLARTGQAGEIAVIEPDSTYQFATTPKGAGGVRQLFSQPENIRMSQYSLQFYKDFAAAMALDEIDVDIEFSQCGYLFVVGEKGAKQLEANHKHQVDQGVNAHLLDKDALSRHYPSLGLSDIVLGCLSPDDGTLSTAHALQGFRSKAEKLGVTYIEARVTDLSVDKQQVRTAQLSQGESIQADIFVCAAGAWSKDILAMVDMPLPVEPMCRVKHFWQCDQLLEPLPLIKDETGLFFRPQRTGFVGGRPSWDIKSGFAFLPENTEINRYFDGYFSRVVRPLLTTRLPAFSRVQSTEAWVGHYAQNTLDGNMILGNLGDAVENFYVACGFSGHGVMHAPAVGLALSELLLKGHFETMDLTRMSYQRVIEDDPYPEQGII